MRSRAVPHVAMSRRTGARPGAGVRLPALLLFFLSAPLLLQGCEGEGRAPAEAEGKGEAERRAAVENGLSTLLQIRGRAADRFTIGERMEHYGVPGVSVAVVDDGAVAWAGGYGVADAETGEPVTPETLFQAASISKPVAAVAALALVEEGTLALDAPVNDRLREWRIPENDFTRTRAVTLRHLLTHTGGLTVHGFPGYAATEEVPTTVQVLDGSGPANTGPVRVDTVPGSIWRYSGGGYTIVQKLLTDVTGRSFPDLMRELVLDPVGMTASSYRQPLPPERERGAASGHLEDGSRVEGEWHVYPEMAAAGLWTNPTELARLALALQAAWRGESDVPLSGETARAMLTPGQGDWGLGFSVQDGEFPRFSHGGSNHGFKAQFLASVEDGRGVFVMTNGERGTPLAMEIVQAVARAYGWPAPVSRKVDVVDLDEDLLSRVAGSYLMEGMDLEISIAARDDHLAVEVGTAPAERYFPLSETEFINLETGDRFQVVTDEDGAVAALEVRGGARALPVR